MHDFISTKQLIFIAAPKSIAFHQVTYSTDGRRWFIRLKTIRQHFPAVIVFHNKTLCGRSTWHIANA